MSGPTTFRSACGPLTRKAGTSRFSADFGKNLVFDIAYVGNRSVGLMILGDLNQARANNVGENLSLQARRPIQAFGYIQSAFNGGFLNYHALQTKLEQHLARILRSEFLHVVEGDRQCFGPPRGAERR